MRAITMIGAAALFACLASPASAQGVRCVPGPGGVLVPVTVGAVVGTGLAVGLHNGVFTQPAAMAATAGSIAGAAAVGGVVGIATIALWDMFTNPCAGVRALIGLSQQPRSR